MKNRLPDAWLETMDLPLIVAPMFLVSSIELVAAACENGAIGSIPTINARTPAILDQWLGTLTRRLECPRADGRRPAPWSLNLLVHSTNSRLPEDLALCVKYRAPLVITALGSPRAAVPAVHDYGGLVFADVSTPEYARKAVQSGADGLVLVCSGAGGHTGQLAAPAFVAAVREFWDGPVVVAGAIADGRSLRATQVMDADLAYMGTRFIASEESSADVRYKQMVVDCVFKDIVCTNAITGAWANKLRPSLVAVGLDPDNLQPASKKFDLDYAKHQPKAWKDIWSAGHGLGEVKAVESAARIIERLKAEYAAAIERELSDPWVRKHAAARNRSVPPRELLAQR
ncbi:MAG: nitronate monooxygenase [Proteobacteria bacterium]|nr:nitronate monooxygenase [Pseudomonadota bacterium]